MSTVKDKIIEPGFQNTGEVLDSIIERGLPMMKEMGLINSKRVIPEIMHYMYAPMKVTAKGKKDTHSPLNAAAWNPFLYRNVPDDGSNVTEVGLFTP